MTCKRCGTELVLLEDGKTWRARDSRGHGVTCPTGGPHRVEVVKADWDSFQDVLDNWGKA